MKTPELFLEWKASDENSLAPVGKDQGRPISDNFLALAKSNGQKRAGSDFYDFFFAERQLNILP